MTAEVIRLVLANGVYLLGGAGLAGLLGVVDARPRTVRRLAAAYLLGAGAFAVAQTYLALLGVTLGWLVLVLVAVVLFVLGCVRVVHGTEAAFAAPPLPSLGSLPTRLAAYGVLAVALAVLAYAGRTIAVRPLLEWDGAAVWALKARVLAELPGSMVPEVLRGTNYGPPSYPLAVPSLEAAGLRAIGRFDASLIDLQLLFLVVGYVGAMWGLLREWCSGLLLALGILVVVASPGFLFQLSTNYADVPLAIFVGAGVAAWLAWVASERDERWLLWAGVVLIGTGGLTKNEGLLFAAAAGACLLGVSLLRGPRRRAGSVLAVAGLAVVVLPWRLYTALADIPTADYDLTNVADLSYLREHAFRVRPVLSELWVQLRDTGDWGYPLILVAIAAAAAVVAGRVAVAAFVASWLALSFGGLVLVYWISSLPLEYNLTNSSFRTVVSLLVTSTSVSPVLLGGAVASASQTLTPRLLRLRARLPKPG
jgi:hypothetical protein